MSLWSALAGYFARDPLGAACFVLLCLSLALFIVSGLLSVLLCIGRRTR